MKSINLILVSAALACSATLIEKDFSNDLLKGNKKKIQGISVIIKSEEIKEITLPVVTIFGERAKNRTIPALSVNLPEVVITAKRTGSVFRFKTVFYNGKNIAEVDLPEVVIMAFKNNHVQFNENKKTDIKEMNPKVAMYRKLRVTNYNGLYIPVVNLPVVEIEAFRAEKLFKQASAELHYPVKKNLREGILVSLKKFSGFFTGFI